MSNDYDENSGNESENDRTKLRPSRKERSRRQARGDELTRVERRRKQRAPQNIVSRTDDSTKTDYLNDDSGMTRVVKRGAKSTKRQQQNKTTQRANASAKASSNRTVNQAHNAPLLEDLSESLGDVNDKMMLVVNAVTPLIANIAKLRFGFESPNFAQLRLDTEKHYNRLKQINFGGETSNEGFIEHISFGLCFFIDDVVMNLPWQSDWEARSLASLYHSHTRGGEEFFARLETLSAEPSKYIQILVLYYVFLELGFVGEHRNKAGEHVNLGQLKQQTYIIICRYRPEDDSILSLKWRGYEQSKGIVLKDLPYWVIASFFTTVCMAVFGYAWWSLGIPSGEVKQSIRLYAVQQPIEVNVRDFGQLDVSPSQENSQSVLEQEPDLVASVDHFQLISDALAANLNPDYASYYTVGSTLQGPVITLVGKYLFQTSQYNVPEPQANIVRNVADYLNQYDLTAEVRGHTDSTPVRFGQRRFRNNFELSERRAQSVFDILRASGVEEHKLGKVGMGASQPVMLDGVEDKSNSRRVEIIIKLKKTVSTKRSVSSKQGSKP